MNRRDITRLLEGLVQDRTEIRECIGEKPTAQVQVCATLHLASVLTSAIAIFAEPLELHHGSMVQSQIEAVNEVLTDAQSDLSARVKDLVDNLTELQRLRHQEHDRHLQNLFTRTRVLEESSEQAATDTSNLAERVSRVEDVLDDQTAQKLKLHTELPPITADAIERRNEAIRDAYLSTIPAAANVGADPTGELASKLRADEREAASSPFDPTH